MIGGRIDPTMMSDEHSSLADCRRTPPHQPTNQSLQPEAKQPGDGVGHTQPRPVTHRDTVRKPHRNHTH
jgi:hypothetical protein